jgi:hypothetical protein
MKGILLNETGDIAVANGGMVIGDTSQQAVQLLFTGAQGEWKEHPTMGIGIKRIQHGAIDRFLDRTIRVQLEGIGFDVKKLDITEKGIELEGDFKDTN